MRDYEAFKAGQTLKVPKVPLAMLTGLPLGKSDWIEVARNAPWQATRMNLNTFARHGVFGDDGSRSDEQIEIAKIVAERLRDRAAIAKARAFPYQLMVAYANVDARVPRCCEGGYPGRDGSCARECAVDRRKGLRAARRVWLDAFAGYRQPR
jgi:60 kDa SS-A/Ro ribonucleoprotein